MHVVIMGCGRVGAALATGLEAGGFTVAVIDQDPTAFRRLGPDFTGSTVTGPGFDREVLQAAGIDRAAGFAAVSSGDNSNIIGARVARETFGVANVVARIYDPRRAVVYERLGIPTVATVSWTADQILRRLVGADPAERWRDPTGQVALFEIELGTNWTGVPVPDLESATGIRVAVLERFGAGTVPGASTVVQEGDRVHVLTTDAGLAAAQRMLRTGPGVA